MGMKLYWTVSEGGEKAFKTQMKNAGDTVTMREAFKKILLENEAFKKILLENGIDENDLNQNTLLVSKKNPFYTAKRNWAKTASWFWATLRIVTGNLS